MGTGFRCRVPVPGTGCRASPLFLSFCLAPPVLAFSCSTSSCPPSAFIRLLFLSPSVVHPPSLSLPPLCVPLSLRLTHSRSRSSLTVPWRLRLPCPSLPLSLSHTLTFFSTMFLTPCVSVSHGPFLPLSHPLSVPLPCSPLSASLTPSLSWFPLRPLSFRLLPSPPMFHLCFSGPVPLPLFLTISHTHSPSVPHSFSFSLFSFLAPYMPLSAAPRFALRLCVNFCHPLRRPKGGGHGAFSPAPKPQGGGLPPSNRWPVFSGSRSLASLSNTRTRPTVPLFTTDAPALVARCPDLDINRQRENPVRRFGSKARNALTTLPRHTLFSGCAWLLASLGPRTKAPAHGSSGSCLSYHKSSSPLQRPPKLTPRHFPGLSGAGLCRLSLNAPDPEPANRSHGCPTSTA